MNNEFSMVGTGGVHVVAMPVDAATKTAIGKEYDKACGKAVALTGNNTVGFGADGDALFGVLCKVEHDGAASVQVKGFVCGLAADASAAIGKYAAVDGAGGIKAAESGRGLITAAENGIADIIL